MLLIIGPCQSCQIIEKNHDFNLKKILFVRYLVFDICYIVFVKTVL